MRHVKPIHLAALACTCILVVGCMPKMTLEEMKAMMPKKPAELEKLNAFAGQWEFEGEANMAMLDKPIKTSGSSDAKWGGDGWYVVSHNMFKMEGLAEMEGIETWTYDSNSKKYRSTWTDSMGSIGSGEATCDDKTNTWNMKATSYGPHGKTWMTGSIKVVDENNMEWTMTEYSGLMKTMEMTGTSRRK